MLVRWFVTQSRLQKLGSKGISRSLAAFPSGKKPNSPSTEPEKNRRPAPPGGGGSICYFLKSGLFTDSGANSGLECGSFTSGERAGALRITSRCRNYWGGFLKGLS